MTFLHAEPVTFEHHREPVGIGESAPRLSWITRTAYELELDDGTATGLVESGESVLVAWPFPPLASVRGAASASGCTVMTARPVTGATGRTWRPDCSTLPTGRPRRQRWRATCSATPTTRPCWSRRRARPSAAPRSCVRSASCPGRTGRPFSTSARTSPDGCASACRARPAR
ncbi:hypothetical protein ACFYUK_21275 [Nonomuraea wenchangensis]